MTCSYRSARLDELDYIASRDLLSDGVMEIDAGSDAFDELRRKLLPFIVDADKLALMAVDDADRPIGMILCRYRDRWREEMEPWQIFLRLPDEIYPPDGRFLEIFQLWVEPDQRRRGIASTLKHAAEQDAGSRGVAMIYTHTAESNSHVIELNRKLGYREVRRGPIWDEVVRVSLVKRVV